MSDLIAVDIDGTLADIHRSLADKITRDYEVHLKKINAYPYGLEDISDWDFGPKIRKLGLKPKLCVDLLHDIWKEQWRYVPLMDLYVPETMSFLVKKYAAVDIVSSDERPDEIIKWLKLHSIKYRNFNKLNPEDKLKYDVLIEDNSALINKLNDSHLFLLKDRPYNRNVPQKDNVKRFNYFWEVPELLKSFDGKSL